MIKEEKAFDKYVEIWERVNNVIIVKKFNDELIYSKKYLIAKKHSPQKKAYNFAIEK